MQRVAALGVAVALSLVGSGAQAQAQAEAQEKTGPPPYPKYQFLRQNENWSVLAGYDLIETGDWVDHLKYISLSADGSGWLTIGGNARARYESWNNFNFGRPNGTSVDDGFLLTRARLYADMHVNERFRAFVEVKTAQSNDRNLPGGTRTLDVDTFALQQAFLDAKIPLGDTDLTLRTGRQELLFGKQRLVSPLPWGNTLRTWDGVSFNSNVAGWNISGFFTQFVPVKKYEFNEPDHEQLFWGLYATHKAESGMTLDAYLLGFDHENVTFNGTSGDEDRYTLGARAGGKIADTGFDYDVEAAYQFGEVGSDDISAYMVSAEAGHTWMDASMSPRVFVGGDVASGDDEAGGDVETFNQLYPLGHAYLGYIDAVGRQNVLATHAGVSIKPTKKVTATASYHLFYLDDEDDAFYNAGGGTSVAGGSSSDDVGSEIDLTVNVAINRHFSALIGYSHFFTADVIEDSAPSTDDTDFAYVSLQYTF